MAIRDYQMSHLGRLNEKGYYYAHYAGAIIQRMDNKIEVIKLIS